MVDHDGKLVAFFVGKQIMSLNRKMHWHQRYEQQQDWNDLVRRQWEAHDRHMFFRPVKVTYFVVSRVEANRDYDNYIGGSKMVTDALRRTFFTRDDAKFLRPPQVKFVVGDFEGTFIVIEEARR